MNVVDLGAVTAQPWRNGGGVTRELLAWPTGMPWQLRISVAEIGRDGDFSAFSGVDRWFAVVEGAGVELSCGNRCDTLTPDALPLQFDGAAAPGCRLLAGPTRDLNLMARRECGHGEMRRVTAGAAWQSPALLRAVFTAEPLTLHTGSAPALVLSGGSLAWSDDGDLTPWQAVAQGDAPRAWWMAYHPIAR